METAEAPDHLLVRLHLDSRGTITAVNAAFDRFACDNDSPHINARAVIGRRLDDFILGDDTRMFVSLLIKGVQALGRETTRLYRCDSPDTRRLMEMRVAPLAEGGVEMAHRVVWSESLRRRTAFTAVGQVVAMARRCSLCNRLQVQGRWWEPDEAPLPEPELPVKVYYGVCQECRADPAGQALQARRNR